MAGDSGTGSSKPQSDDDDVSGLTILGAVITLIVGLAMIAAVVIQVCSKEQNPTIAHMRLNEWGDFLAGGCALIAATWLIIGYFQQNRELRMTSKALRMQADELKHQVEETRNLVETSIRQAEAAERMAMWQSADRQPRFVGTLEGFDGRVSSNWHVQNHGAGATVKQIEAVPPLKFVEEPAANIYLGKGRMIVVKITGDSMSGEHDHRRLRVTYETYAGNQDARLLEIIDKQRMVEVPDEGNR